MVSRSNFQQIIIPFIIGMMLSSLAMAQTSPKSEFIKKSDVAGRFYKADPKALVQHLQEMMAGVSDQKTYANVSVIMVPHAGHVYSGPTAAYGFEAIQDKNIKTVILLGPTHYYQFSGVAIWPQGEFETPLGMISVDQALAQSIMQKAPFVQPQLNVFHKDHVLEVELPFLQHLFGDIQIVPMIMNRQATAQEVKSLAQALYQSVGNREDVLLLISSDLAHFHSAEKGKKIDMHGLDAIEKMDVQKLWNEHAAGKMEIDGYKEVIVGLLYAQMRGGNAVELLKYAHSGEISGDHSKVVGYASMVFYEKEQEQTKSVPLNRDQKKKLMDTARRSVIAHVAEGKKIEVNEQDKRLLEEEGAFVSIYKDGKLRGCIGHIFGKGPLCLTVRNMAMASATEDRRFKPVSKEELENIELEISVLSKPWTIANVDEIELGTHGVIISQGGKSGVFLPQVADSTGWSKEEFLGQLCSQKAGLPWECWKDPKTRIQIYTADVFTEKDLNK